MDSPPERDREKERELIVQSRKAINAADGASALAVFSSAEILKAIANGSREGMEEGEKIWDNESIDKMNQ